MYRLGTRRLFILTLTFGLLAGCSGDSGPTQHPVSGKVTYNGQPIKEGKIAFIPVDSAQAAYAVSSDFVEGNYSAQVPEGTMKVSVFASWDTSETELSEDGVTQIPIRASLAAKFNEFSELTVEIKSGANSNVNFDLTE